MPQIPTPGRSIWCKHVVLAHIWMLIAQRSDSPVLRIRTQFGVTLQTLDMRWALRSGIWVV